MGDLILSFEDYRKRSDRLKKLEALHQAVGSFLAMWRMRRDASNELQTLWDKFQEVEKLKFTVVPPKEP